MTIGKVLVNGEWCHADDDGLPLLEDNGSAIPANICICFAYGPTECCCGAWDWKHDDYEPEWD